MSRLTEQDREIALNRLKSSRKLLTEVVDGLTPEQWHFKPGPDQWSIAECVEHIAVAEASGLDRNRMLMETPLTPDKQSAYTDVDLMSRVGDGSQKFKAPERVSPAKRWSDPRQAVARFEESRDSSIQFLKYAGGDLRDHFAVHPAFGEIDAYQWVLLRAGHTERHAAQIRAIRAEPGFPK